MATTLREDSLVYGFDTDADGAFWLARQLVEQWLREHHVRSDAVSDMLLVANELCVGAGGGVVLRGRVDGMDVELEVETPALDPLAPSAGDLRLAAALCDEIVLRVRPDHTVVIARRHGIVLP